MRDLSVLSDIEFEGLVADLLAAEIGVPVERFAAGPDGGVDLRWRSPLDTSVVIGQCKHYPRSTFAQLLAAARAELRHIKALQPSSYRFITSADLTAGQKSQLHAVFASWMGGPDDVLGRRDIDGLLTRHPTVERRHPKLWLSAGSQLFWITHSALANRSSALRDRLSRSLPRYVINNTYHRASDILEKHRVCIIAGLPGIGKTMLAEVLLADAMTRGYEPVEVSHDIDEAWTALHGNDLQAFLYDDFLGQLSFAERLGKNEDRRLSDLVSKIAGMKTKLLIMTTREYILRDARRTYELLNHLDQQMHFILKLEDYTRRDRARILYNHLWHANIAQTALQEVAAGGYRPIVDHRNYSPRLIELCTSVQFDTANAGYVARCVDLLDHPERLWRRAFETHLTPDQQLLAVSLATLPPTVDLDDLQDVHRTLCDSQAVPHSALLFRAATQVMEGTFLATGRTHGRITARFHNPSVREFVLDWLAEDRKLLATVVRSALYFEQIAYLYAYSGQSTTSGSHPRLRAELDRLTGDIVSGIARLMLSPSPERRNEWVPTEGEVYRRPSSWFEDRLAGVLGLPSKLRPSSEWIAQQVQTVADRWRRKEGSKPEGVLLLRQLEGMARSTADGVIGDVVENARAALDTWLATDPEDTELDWLPYLDRLEHDHGVRLADDRPLARRFETFARDELSRWSPSPPNLDDLLTYAKRFDLPDLVHDLEESVREDDAREEEVSARATRPGPVASATDSEQLDSEALDSMFRRLAPRTQEPG